MKKQFASLLLLCWAFMVSGQIGVGEWREHLPYRKAFRLEEADNRIFCLTESGLFSYSFEDNRVETYSKISGLSDAGISSMAFSSEKAVLLVGYSNGNIDLLAKGRVTNIPDIRDASIAEEKRINDFFLENDKAMIATGFGIVVINLGKAEVSDTYYIGDGGSSLRVNGLVNDGSFYWAATEKGVFRALTSTSNLVDYNRWEHMSDLPNWEWEVTHILSVDQRIFVVRSISENQSQIMAYRDGVWKELVPSLAKVTSFREEDGRLWVVAEGTLRVFDLNGLEVDRLENVDGKPLALRDALQLSSGRRFFADYGRSLLEYHSGEAPVEIHPNGPANIEVADMLSYAGSLWMVPGGVSYQYQGNGTEAGGSIFSEELWTDFSSETSDELKGKTDLHVLAPDPLNLGRVYAGSWGSGLWAIDREGEVQVWDGSNSPLGNGSVRIGGIATDDSRNLWVLDAGVNDAIKVKTPDEEWISLYYAPLSNKLDLKKILVTSFGDKWILTGERNPFFVLNENQTLSNNKDDSFKTFSVKDENGQSLTNVVYDMVEDKDGGIWLGTDKGVMVYAQPENVFRNQPFFAYRPIISLEGQTQYLLGTEQVSCLAVDGANQKWLGTENSGVFLVSESGDQQLHHFNATNSPLLSNRIRKIEIDPSTGEVFFATDKGLISFRSSATEGADNLSGLYVFPNPVREDYHGDIVVTGLMENSTVKITDVSGNLVFEGRSSGGQFVWDGRNFSGSRVHTGVYLIFCASEDGAQSNVTKLLFIH